MKQFFLSHPGVRTTFSTVEEGASWDENSFVSWLFAIVTMGKSIITLSCINCVSST